MAMSQYQQFIHMSRYARWREDLGKREGWEQTVDRYVEFFRPRLNNDEKMDEIREAILNMEIMPSMRAFMTAGKALTRDNVAGYNCLAGETEVLTQNGMKKIREALGETEVLNSEGEWTPALIRNFGVQKLVPVTFNAGSRKLEVRTTEEHDWVLTDGRRVKTRDLKKGDKVPYLKAPRKNTYDSIDYRLGILHGLIYGDGTSTKNQGGPAELTYSQERVKGYMIRICSDIEDILPLFEGYRVSYPESYGGDPVVYLFDSFAKTHDLKNLPGEEETEDYLIGFFRGWFAADGHIDKTHGRPAICCGGDEEKWLRKNLTKFGYWFHEGSLLTGETSFKRVKDSRNVYIDRASFTPEDSIIKRKRESFKPLVLDSYSFTSIDLDNSKEEEVFCAEVPETHSFVLNMGLLTGNCSYVAVDHPVVFDEIMYILMCGTGVGFSVERQYVAMLPAIAAEFHETESIIKVKDSKIGWASAFRELISLLYGGLIPKWDVSGVRQAGTRLKTFGGRASGPEPLVDLFNFTVNLFTKAAGRKLNSVECHDLVCKIADIVVVGGVRRSALISLSNLSDDRMRNAKNGQWWLDQGQRTLANNSTAYTEKPEPEIFLKEWLSLIESKSGERGIFNRVAATRQAMLTGRRNYKDYEFGTNPCGEIILRSKGFCNLTEVIIRPEDTEESLARKIELATILGTLQSTLTNFRYLRREWQRNAEEERLLGLSLTGIMDHELTSGKLGNAPLEALLDKLKKQSIQVNAEWAAKLGINPAAAITCVKPSGTVSQLVDCASGIHPRYSNHYVRRVRADMKDPLAKMLIAQGVPFEPEATKPNSVAVFAFPVAAPEHAVFRNDRNAIEQLELYLVYQKAWCEHNPSITIYVKDSEWVKVAAWVDEHFEEIGGVSFLPHTNHVYRQAPYVEVTKEEYLKLKEEMPVIDWTQLTQFEKYDQTEGTRELACTAGACEIL